MPNNFSLKSKIYGAIFLIWLFHISGIIGIELGHEDWFASKTPLNLMVSAIIFFALYPVNSLKKVSFFLLFFFIGMMVEWLGVKYSLLFGSYQYGGNLGPKLDGVPIFIGIYWALLTFITSEIVSFFAKMFWARVVLAALLMVLLDFFMEQCAPRFDFWSFGEQVPLFNYLSWFAVAFVLQILFLRAKISGNKKIALHLYMSQLVFFAFFTFFTFFTAQR